MNGNVLNDANFSSLILRFVTLSTSSQCAECTQTLILHADIEKDAVWQKKGREGHFLIDSIATQ
jgi:hypothetical protein